MTFLVPYPGKGVVRSSYRFGSTNSTGGGTHTYSSVDLDAPEQNRRIVVLASANFSDITAISVAGIAATIHATVSTGTLQYGAIASASVPTGLTGNVAITSSSMTLMGCAVFSMYGAAPTAFDQDSSASTISLDIPEGGCAMAIGVALGAGIGASWSGLTERFDSFVSGPGYHFTAAGDDLPTAQTGRSISRSAAATTNFVLGASFGP